MRKVLLVLLSAVLIILTFSGCANSPKDETKTTGEVWGADKFLDKYANFEENLMDFLNFNSAVGLIEKDNERIEEFINECIEKAGVPDWLYPIHKAYKLETELGTVFETISLGEGGYEKVLFPKTMIKDVILQLFDIEESKINWQDFNSIKENDDYFGVIMVYGGGIFEAEILYDTLTYSTSTNIVTFDIKYYTDSNPPRQFELCTIKYKFQPFLYKDKIQAYKFISVERVS